MLRTRHTWIRKIISLAVLGALGAAATPNDCAAQPVPGRGTKLTQVGDDFEDEKWEYIPRLPKSSSNIDKRRRSPTGISRNGRVFESSYRGAPDIVKRVETPPGGLPGSKGAMAMQTLRTGIPNYVTNKMQQDDFMVNVNRRVGAIPVQRNPSAVVRVYLPPWEEWEQRTGSSFGFRLDLIGEMKKEEEKRTLFGGKKKKIVTKRDAYWPGFFIQFNSKNSPQFEYDHAVLLIRCDQYGKDVVGPRIHQPGWWTLGMSVTSNGSVHYFARAGIEDLRPQDHLYSSFPYSARAEQLHSVFFNIVNIDDGKTWSTKWIVDDPSIYHYTR